MNLNVFKATVFTVIIVITTLMITKMLFSRNAKDFRGGKRNLQNLNSVQKKCQPSVFTPEVQLEDWHRVDHDCCDVPAFKRKIERLQKLCRGLRPIFASSSDRTLGWIRTHSRGDQITNQPTVRVCKSRPTVRFWSAQKICTVVMCTHSTTPLCETAILLVQPRSQRHRRSPENFPRSQNHNDPTFGRCHSSSVLLTGAWVVFLGSCYVLFYSTLLLPCCFASRHTTLLLLVWQLTQVGLGRSWCKKDSQKNTQKPRKSRSPYFLFSFEAWPSEEKYIFTQIHAVCFCIGCVISDIGPSLLFRPIL